MGWKIREDWLDYERIDPKTGEAPPKATSLSRVLGEYSPGLPRRGDERVFVAGMSVPDNYISDSIRERYEEGDEKITSIFEYTEGDGNDLSKLKPGDLDDELTKRGITLESGSGKNGNVIKEDKLAAIEAYDASRPAGDPTQTVVPSGNPFA